MNDYISKEDIKILLHGLDLYESEPVHNGMMGSMIKAVLLGRNGRNEKDAVAETKAEVEQASAESDKRKNAVARLRVKLIEMAEHPSEFPQ